jgi:Cellulose biosynthesis protein BcsS
VLALRETVERGIWAGLRASGAGGVLLLVLSLPASEALAEPDQPRTEYFTGFEVSDNYTSGYVGAGYAFGKAGYAAPGFRLRAVGAYGRYDYQGSLLLDSAAQPTTFDGQDGFAAALIGYEFRPGRLIVKLFAGIEGEDQHIVPHDPNNSVQGTALGLRLQAESWIDLSSRTFLSADASYGTAFQEYWSLVRLGYRLMPRLSLGLEGGALGNEEYDAGRGGGFARVNFRTMEVTLSGGFTGNYLEDDPSGYVALGIYRPF